MGEQALYAAESGVEEARARLRVQAGAARIEDPQTDSPLWRVYIGDAVQAHDQGYDASQHERVASLQDDLDYTVMIRHALHGPDQAVVRWGDDDGDGVNTRNATHGEVIYRITGYGAQHEARKTVEIEAVRVPSLTVPSALSVGGQTTLQSSRLHVTDQDSCASHEQPGVTRAASPMGSQESTLHTNIHVQAMIETLKDHANVVYTPAMAGQHATSPAPAEQWGTPHRGAPPQEPSVCQAHHVVYYDTRTGAGRLSHGVSGCGLLLVDGDVEIHGDFSWHGAILVAGSVRLTGEGTKHITGGVLVAGSVTAEQGGDTHILYCREAVQQQTRTMPLRILSWRNI
jgi:hypothetical protein